MKEKNKNIRKKQHMRTNPGVQNMFWFHLILFTYLVLIGSIGFKLNLIKLMPLTYQSKSLTYTLVFTWTYFTHFIFISYIMFNVVNSLH